MLSIPAAVCVGVCFACVLHVLVQVQLRDGIVSAGRQERKGEGNMETQRVL